jgi:RNA polymerase subunit RPABC4/transcription elongation factor Spt4
MSDHKICRSCGEILTIENKLENKLGVRVKVCLNCLRLTITEVAQEERQKYVGLEKTIVSK